MRIFSIQNRIGSRFHGTHPRANHKRSKTPRHLGEAGNIFHLLAQSVKSPNFSAPGYETVYGTVNRNIQQVFGQKSRYTVFEALGAFIYGLIDEYGNNESFLRDLLRNIKIRTFYQFGYMMLQLQIHWLSSTNLRFSYDDPQGMLRYLKKMNGKIKEEFQSRRLNFENLFDERYLVCRSTPPSSGKSSALYYRFRFPKRQRDLREMTPLQFARAMGQWGRELLPEPT